MPYIPKLKPFIFLSVYGVCIFIAILFSILNAVLVEAQLSLRIFYVWAALIIFLALLCFFEAFYFFSVSIIVRLILFILCGIPAFGFHCYLYFYMCVAVILGSGSLCRVIIDNYPKISQNICFNFVIVGYRFQFAISIIIFFGFIIYFSITIYHLVGYLKNKINHQDQHQEIELNADD